MYTYQVRTATHIGRAHLLSFQNRQDAYSTFEGNIYDYPVRVGVICDGCSEGRKSEVGAGLAADFLVREIVFLLERNVPVSAIPKIAYSQLLMFLRDLLQGYRFSNYADRVNFIQHHLLFTVVCFIVTDTDASVFLTGDGTIIINDERYLVESDNKPLYPAYHLVDCTSLEESASTLPASFDVWPIERGQLHRLAIGSDAWHQEQDLLEQIWNYSHPAGLQRKINQWSKKERRFADDVTIITLEIHDSHAEEETNASRT